jgi:hypothetical protein
MESCSQAGQDIFVRKMLNNKRQGYFLEIGSAEPIICNNTYILEKKFDWIGIMVEYEKIYETKYTESRKSKFIIDDARKINYFIRQSYKIAE